MIIVFIDLKRRSAFSGTRGIVPPRFFFFEEKNHKYRITTQNIEFDAFVKIYLEMKL